MLPPELNPSNARNAAYKNIYLKSMFCLVRIAIKPKAIPCIAWFVFFMGRGVFFPDRCVCGVESIIDLVLGDKNLRGNAVLSGNQ